MLKPSRGYGGDGVVIGQTLSGSQWEQALDAALADVELWVVQSLAHIPVLEVPTLRRGRHAAAGDVLPRDGLCVGPRGPRDPGARVAAAGGERGPARRNGAVPKASTLHAEERVELLDFRRECRREDSGQPSAGVGNTIDPQCDQTLLVLLEAPARIFPWISAASSSGSAMAIRSPTSRKSRRGGRDREMNRRFARNW